MEILQEEKAYWAARPLSAEESKRVQRIIEKGEKISLYALDPQHDGE